MKLDAGSCSTGDTLVQHYSFTRDSHINWTGNSQKLFDFILFLLVLTNNTAIK